MGPAIVWGTSEIGTQHKKRKENESIEAQEKKYQIAPITAIPKSQTPKLPIIVARLLGYDIWWLRRGDRLSAVFPSVWERRHFGDY